MKKLQIDETKARTLFKTASPEFKEMLIDSFSKEFFSEKITDRVKTWEDALNAAGACCYQAGTGLTQREIATRRIELIVTVLNEGWTPDWSNQNQVKYYPYFRLNSEGTGFAGVGYGGWYAGTFVGSRLCFKSYELALYAGNQFKDLYEIMLLK